jgi:hypothetical protein
MSWYEQVVDVGGKPLLPSLTPTPYEKGIIASQSVNDILMIKGLIDPLQYIRYFDLDVFSRP